MTLSHASVSEVARFDASSGRISHRHDTHNPAYTLDFPLKTLLRTGRLDDEH